MNGQPGLVQPGAPLRKRIMKTKIDIEKLIEVLLEKGFKIFDRADELNIVGVRSVPGEVNQFDDLLIVFYTTESGEKAFHIYPATTDPGRYWLENPSNVEGTAILVPGQYPVYKYDLHNGHYMALCERRGPVTVYRDPNRDDKLDFGGKTETGYFGINIHHAGYSGVTKAVDKFSAGCQVFQSIDDFNEVMQLVQKHISKFGNEFTYTLLTEGDFTDLSDVQPKPMDKIPVKGK